ncbi:calcium-binding protein [Methylophilus sp.]|jgi:serralysin|uniref:beta strand repeat-containing protein n=1 Tax=Methylophilus sp. TaxID=29541 RepID=UPI0011D5E98D|nr:calcium-binding protein [Methylophilus sp.]TXI44779.1 MAG: calcium-binding protein [Methylophilus sp.]
MKLQYNNLEELDLGAVETAISGAFNTPTTFLNNFDLDSITPTSGNNTRVTGYDGNGNQIVIRGNHFVDDSPIITVTSVDFSNSSTASFKVAGSVSLNYYTGVYSGYYSSFTYQSKTNNESIQYVGRLNVNSFSADITGGTLTQMSVVNDDFSYSIKGSISVNADVDIIGGTVSDFSLSDANGNSLSFSGMSLSALTFEQLSDFQANSDLTNLFNYISNNLSGNFSIQAGSGDQALVGNEGNNTLDGGIGDDTLNGGDGLDTLIGGAGNDFFDGGAGVDKLIGGNGDDTYIVDLILTGTAPANYKVALQDTITETAAAGSGTDTVILRGTFTEPTTFTTLTLGANLENLDASDTGLTKLNLTGNALNNTLTGNDANNILDGGAGVDTLRGGEGNDTYILDLKATAGILSIEDTLVELNGTTDGIDTVKLRGTATLATAATLILDNDWSHVEILDASATGSTKLNLTGNNLGNTLIGNAAVNILTGGTGDDTLNGGAGADSMIGGDGNDTYIVDNIADAITEDSNEGTDLVKASVSYTLGANLESLELTGTSAINGTGNGLDNIITGNAGNNILDGGAGADTLIGGKGNDTYIVDDEDDEVIENFNEGTDLVKASVDYELTDFVENLTLTGNDQINGTGNALANTITGNAGNNILDGGTSVDKLIGGNGDDTYIVDLVRTGTAPANYKVALQDTITETTVAGSGTDTVILRTTYTGMLNASTITLGANLENLDASLTADTNLNLTGNALANTLIGNDANNILDGGAGVDRLVGGLGDDTYMLDLKTTVISGVVTATFDDSITETNGITNGSDTIKLRGTATLSTATTLTLDGEWADIENIDASATGKTKLNLTGNSLNNILTGNAAANILTGGNGNDTYVVNNIDDTIIEEENEGIDLIQTSITYSLALADNVENLELIGTAAINGTGNDEANIITGNAGNNILDGKGGIDTLRGGKGNDTYIVNDELDVVTELANEGIDLVKASSNFTLSDNVENLTLTDGSANGGTTPLEGTGNTLANTITGNAGNNTLDGGVGVDKLIGGNGDDTYIVDLVRTGTTAANYKVALQDTITETAVASSGIDTVILRGGSTDPTTFTTLTLGANLENINASDTGSTKINLTGNALANTLIGNDANNILDGGAGVDTLQGGEGDDTYILDLKATVGILSIEDTVEEFNSTTDGSDTIKLRGSVTLTEATTLSLDGSTAITWSHVENIDASATKSTKLNLTGNEFDNTLTGNAGANILDGGMGNDTLNGGAGNDTLIGALGKDTLTGGLGADVFKWTTSDLVAPGDVSGNTDTITDFSIAQKDKLDLRDLLMGEELTDSILNYIDIEIQGSSTLIHISSTGDFTGGAYDAAKEDAQIILSNINLFTATKTAAGHDAQLIGYLTQNNYLLID